MLLQLNGHVPPAPLRIIPLAPTATARVLEMACMLCKCAVVPLVCATQEVASLVPIIVPVRPTANPVLASAKLIPSSRLVVAVVVKSDGCTVKVVTANPLCAKSKRRRMPQLRCTQGIV